MVADGDGSSLAVPTVGLLAVAVLVAGIPHLSASVSVTEGLLRWVLWGIATLVMVYIAISFWRLARTEGVFEAIRWLLSGSVPPGR